MIKSVKITQKTHDGILRRYDIIQSILASNYEGVVQAIDEDVSCINSIHEASGMNAAMLAVIGRMPLYVELIMSYGSELDFNHRDKQNRDLMDAAMASQHKSVWNIVVTAYKTYAPHIINNWPEP